MPWYIFAIIAAVLVSVSTIIEKKTLQREHAMEFSTILAIIALVLSLPFFLVTDFSRLEAAPLAILFFNCILGSLSVLYTAKGLRHMDVSSSSPLYAIAPALTALLAMIFLGEKLTGLQISGLVLLILGTYVLEKRGTGWFEPFKVLKESRYIHYVLLSILLISITAVIDRLVLARYEMQIEAYLAFAHLFVGIILLSMYGYRFGNLRHLNIGFKRYGLVILLIGILTITHRYANSVSTQLAYVGLVTAIKRSSSLFITLIGGTLFHEENLAAKTAACLIMIIGMLMVII